MDKYDPITTMASNIHRVLLEALFFAFDVAHFLALCITLGLTLYAVQEAIDRLVKNHRR